MSILINNTQLIAGEFQKERFQLGQKVGRLKLNDQEGDIGGIRAIKIKKDSWISYLVQRSCVRTLAIKIFFGDFKIVQVGKKNYLVSKIVQVGKKNYLVSHKSCKRALLQAKVLRQFDQFKNDKYQEDLKKLKNRLQNDKTPFQLLCQKKDRIFIGPKTQDSPAFLLFDAKNPQVLLTTKFLGSGGFKDVRKAINITKQTKHAVALIRDSNWFVRLLTGREHNYYQELKQKNIPNIVGIDSLLEDPDRNLVGIMAYCKQGDLVDHLKQISHDEKVKLFAHLAKIVADLHAQGIVHRDLKAENFLIDKDGNVSLGDFGITADTGELKLGIGTPLYLPPETKLLAPVRSTQDAWAFGVMLCKAFISIDHPIRDFVLDRAKNGKKPINGMLAVSDARIEKAIEGLLRTKPKERLTMKEVCDILKQ